MSVKKAFIGLIFVAVVVGITTFFNQPKQRTFPFSRPLELLPDYRPPGEGVTLYPTGGPFGFDVIETITTGVDEKTLFVGTFGGGLFRTTDQGKHWKPVNHGLRDKFIATLFILENEAVFVSTIRTGLFKSSDNGDHWASVNTGLEKVDVNTLSMLPSGPLLAGTSGGVYISRDKGSFWEPFNEGLSHEKIQSIVVTKDEIIFAATQGSGIYKRKVGDEKWVSAIAAFAFEGLEERSVRALVLGRGEAIYAGTMSGGVFRSLDGGEHWGSANTGIKSLSIRALGADSHGILYAGTGEGVYYSENDGQNWHPLLEGMQSIQILSFVANKGGNLYVGSAGGIYRGKVGMTWEPLHDQLLISPISALNYGEEGITVGTEGKGTYINKQDNWMSDNLGLVNLTIRALARGKIFIYAVTNDGVYRRQIGRHQWSALPGAPSEKATLVSVDALDRVYIGTGNGLFSSSDHGMNWTEESELASKSIKSLTLDGETLFAATENEIWSKNQTGWEKIITKEGHPFQVILWRKGKGLLAVTDHKIWERDLQGIWRELKSGGPEGVEIESIAIDPHNSDILYAGTNRGLFWSLDNGLSWERANLYQGDVFEGKVNQVLPTDSSALWLATEADGVVIGMARAARRNIFTRWLDDLNDFDFSFSNLSGDDGESPDQG